MTWTIWCNAYEQTSQIQDTTLYQNLTFTENYSLTGMRTWVILVGTPMFSELVMKIYGNDDQASPAAPTKLLATSTNKFQTSDLVDEFGNGVKEIYFNFDNFMVREGTTYNFVLNATTYFPTPTSYLAWRKAFPDPVIQQGYVPTTINSNQAPYELYPYGAPL